MEPNKKFDIKKFLYTVICGLIFSIIIGIIFFQTHVFNHHSPSFAFVTFGLVGAVVFAALSFRNIKDSILFTIMLLIINFTIYSGHSFKFALRDILSFAAIWLSMYLYDIWFIPKVQNMRYIRALGLGVIFATCNVVAGVILILIFIIIYDMRTQLIPILFSYLQTGMLVGLGLGIGFDLAETIARKM